MTAMREDQEIALLTAQKIRRQILRLLLIAGPDMGSNEKMIVIALQSMGFPVLTHEVRRHLDYLEGLNLITVIDRDRSVWAATITPAGTDVLEGAVKPPPGVAKE